jgi:hypothetical protein
MKLGMFTISYDAILTTDSVSHFDKYFQHHGLSNCCGIKRNVTYLPEALVVTIGSYIFSMPPELISMAHFANLFHL